MPGGGCRAAVAGPTLGEVVARSDSRQGAALRGRYGRFSWRPMSGVWLSGGVCGLAVSGMAKGS